MLRRGAPRAGSARVRRGHRGMARRDAALVVLVTGRIEPAGDGLVIRSLVPPAVAGVSLAVGAPPSAALRAAEDSAFVVLPAAAVAAALRRHPEAALAAIAHLAGRLAGLGRRSSRSGTGRT